LEDFKHLSTVGVSQVAVTDAAMARLAKLKGLKIVNFVDTLVTDHGISQLHSALPGCRITMLSGGKIKTISGARPWTVSLAPIR
jgi:hypothetical protein